MLQSASVIAALRRARGRWLSLMECGYELSFHQKSLILKHLRNTYHYDAVANPYKTVWIDPARATTYSEAFGRWEGIAGIEPGDWDLETIPLGEHPKYRATVEHFERGVPWDETGVYEYLIGRAERGRAHDGCETFEDVERRYEGIDELFESISRDGYDHSYHTRVPNRWGSPEMDYIAVHVTRDGEFTFAGSGTHRLAISHVLELDAVPVWIRTRHTAWQRTRERFIAPQESVAPELESHPDLRDLR